MANIENRVVGMKFNNAEFKRGVSDTLSALDRLKGALSGLSGASKGLEDVSKSAGRFSLSGITSSLQQAMGGFSALGVVAATTLATITQKATAAGSQLVKSMTLDPVMDGFAEYELKMGSIQTIMANTNRHGTTLETVNRELEELNKYADKTIYNFAEMTKNASLFTNSGMKIEEATTVIKGWSNSAAASGTSAAEAAHSAQQMTQAISAGVIKAQDWMSVTNAGMGNKNMQDGIIAIAKGMGTFNGKSGAATMAAKNFKGSLEEGWLTADVMSTYLKAMSGDMTDAELAAKGLDSAQIKMLQNQAKIGLDAATKVRTFSGLMSTLKESVTSGWTTSFETIFGDFNEATTLFTGVSDAIGGMLTKSGDARNKMLTQWKAAGGRADLIEGIKNVWGSLIAVLRSVRQAFSEAFPAMTGKRLAEITKSFRDFTEKMKVGSETFQQIKSTFEGVFAVLSIGKMLLEGFVRAFFGLFMTVGEGAGGLLSITAVVGEFLAGIRDLIAYTGLIEKFFSVFLSPLLLIKPLIGLVSDLVFAFNSLFMGDVSGFAERFQSAFGSFGTALSSIGGTVNAFVKGIGFGLGGLSDFLSSFADKAKSSGNGLVSGIASALSGVTGVLSTFLSDVKGTIDTLIVSLTSATNQGKNFLAGFGGASLSTIIDIVSTLLVKFDELRNKLDFSAAFSTFNTGASTVATGGVSVLSGAGSAASAIFNGLGNLFSNIGSALAPMLESLSGFFTTLVEKLRGYVASLDMGDAVSLLNTAFFIALYIAIRKFMNNLSGLVGQIGDVMDSITGVFDQLTSTLKSMQQSVRATMILKIAVAIGILVGALFVLAKIPADDLKKALVALTVVFAQVSLMLLAVTRINPQSMMGSAGGMILLATAILILTKAIQKLGETDPKVLIQGGVALGIMMAALAGMVRVLNGMKGIFAAAAGLLILSAALNALVVAVLVYAKLDWATIIDGVGAMAATLVALGLAMHTMPPGMIAQSAALVILSGALVVLAGVVGLFGSLPIGVVVQGLLSMAGALLIMSVAANSMVGALPGAAAMLVMAGAIALLVPALAMLGSLSMSTIGKGLLALTAVMTIFVVSMYALTPVIAVLAIFASSIMTLGLAMLAAGAGFGLFVAGLGALTVIGAAGFAVLTLGIMSVLNLLPLMAQQVGHAIVAFALVIAKSAPKVMHAMGEVIMALVNEVAKRVPELAAAGLDMILGFLKAIRDRIGEITTVAIQIVIEFISAIDAQLGHIISRGVEFILSFIEGLADAIRGNRERVGSAGADLATAIVEGLVEGLQAIGSMLGPAIERVGRAMINAFKALFGINSPSTVFSGFGRNIIEGLIKGIGGLAGSVISKVRDVGGKIISAARGAISKATEVGRTFITSTIRGIGSSMGSLLSKGAELARSAISAAKGALSNASDIGSEIVRGMIRGIGGGLDLVKDAARNLAKGALDAAKGFLGIKSPSKEFAKIGKYVNQGFVQGLTQGSRETATATYNNMRDVLSAAMQAATEDISEHEARLKKLTSARVKDTEAIAKTRAELAESRSELNKAKSAHTELTTTYLDEQRTITKLSDEYTVLSKKLEEADKVLEDSIKTRDDYANSLTDQYDNLLDVTSDSKNLSASEQKAAASAEAAKAADLAAAAADRQAKAAEKEAAALERVNKLLEEAKDPKLSDYERGVKLRAADREAKAAQREAEAAKAADAAADAKAAADAQAAKDAEAATVKDKIGVTEYIAGMQAKAEETKRFATLLQKLRDMGLNDVTYQELLSKGVDAMPFMEKLEAMGPGTVNEINKVTEMMQAEAKKLGTKASQELYQAGVDSAQGIVNGIKSRQSTIIKEMEALATAMLTAIKKKLGIKSPSREFAKLGAFATSGMAVGLKSGVGNITSAAEFVADESLNTMRETLKKLSQGLDSEMDLNPTIAPVLDLTAMRKEAIKIGSVLGTQPISVSAAYSGARAASAGYNGNKELTADSVSKSSEQIHLEFKQYNNSPKALSPADIYRQTKNQLSVAKGALV